MTGREKEPRIPQKGEIPIGVAMRVRRRMQGLSVSGLAFLTGDFPGSLGPYSVGHISKVEMGKAKPSGDLVRRVCEVLHVTEEELRFTTREKLLEWQNAIPQKQPSNR